MNFQKGRRTQRSILKTVNNKATLQDCGSPLPPLRLCLPSWSVYHPCKVSCLYTVHKPTQEYPNCKSLKEGRSIFSKTLNTGSPNRWEVHPKLFVKYPCRYRSPAMHFMKENITKQTKCILYSCNNQSRKRQKGYSLLFTVHQNRIT